MITIDQKIADYLNSWQIDGWPVGNLILCVIALLLCVILVGLIGIEREIRGRSAGLRTHLLVGVSSTILMIISVYGFPAIFSEKRDVARLAAQIVTGVGFLGAGAILHRNSGIKGLTTAGTIWASMAIGIACGSFNFILALLTTVVILVVMTTFRKMEAYIVKKTPSIVMVVESDVPVSGILAEMTRKYECRVHPMTISNVEGTYDKPRVEIIFRVNLPDGGIREDEFIEELRTKTKAISIALVNHR